MNLLVFRLVVNTENPVPICAGGALFWGLFKDDDVKHRR
jgi:hypothetical protein